MMRCIDHPTMVKDGSGWGCMAGLSAAYLAQKGFTGAPAVTVEQEQGPWSDLGVRWRILEQYFKPQPVCRWAHPAIDAPRALRLQHGFTGAQIRSVTVRTFRHATRLAHAAPATTEAAQYSLLFPVAVALAHGVVDLDAIQGEGLEDAGVLRLSHLIRLEEDVEFNARFPHERWADVSVELDDGRRFASGPRRALGDPDLPMGAAAIRRKFHRFSEGVCGTGQAAALERAVDELCRPDAPAAPFLDLVLGEIRVERGIQP